MSGNGSPTNAIEGAVTSFSPTTGLVATEPQVAAIFYILLIFLAVYVMSTFNLWSKLKDAVPGHSNFKSHLSNSTDPLTLITANPTINSPSMLSPSLGHQAYSGFKSHLSIPKGKGAIDSVMMKAASGGY